MRATTRPPTPAERERMRRARDVEVPARLADAALRWSQGRVVEIAGFVLLLGAGAAFWLSAGMFTVAATVLGVLLAAGGEAIAQLARRDRRDAERFAEALGNDLAADAVQVLDLHPARGVRLMADGAALLDVGDGWLVLVRDVPLGSTLRLVRAPISGWEGAEAVGELSVGDLEVDHGDLSLPHPLEGSVEGLDPRVCPFRGTWDERAADLGRLDGATNPWTGHTLG